MTSVQEPNTTSVQNKKNMYFPELDGLRFFAFLLVFFHHRDWYPIDAFAYLHQIGWIGVDLFFVLSAFLFTKLLISEYEKSHTISFRKFYIRRILRIVPLYLFIIIVSLLFYRFVEGSPWSTIEPKRLIGLLTYTDNIVTALHGYNSLPFVSHLWTISYEEQFYIFIPLLILFLVKSTKIKKIVLFIGAFLLFNGIRLLMIKFQAPHPAIWVLPVSHFESMLFGIVIGFGGFDFIAKYIKPFFIVTLSIFFVFLLFKLPSVDVINPTLFLSYLLIGLSSSFALLAVLNSVYLKNMLSHRFLVFLGKRSYGLYVFHVLGNKLVDFFVKFFPNLPCTPFATFMYSLFFTVTLSVISYALLEKPFLRLKGKFEVITSRPV